MKLFVNGDVIDDLPDPLSVSGLIEALDLPSAKIAVELNLEIVSKSTFDKTMLKDDDKLEIIHFIGGG